MPETAMPASDTVTEVSSNPWTARVARCPLSLSKCREMRFDVTYGPVYHAAIPAAQPLARTVRGSGGAELVSGLGGVPRFFGVWWGVLYAGNLPKANSGSETCDCHDD